MSWLNKKIESCMGNRTTLSGMQTVDFLRGIGFTITIKNLSRILSQRWFGPVDSIENKSCCGRRYALNSDDIKRVVWFLLARQIIKAPRAYSKINFLGYALKMVIKHQSCDLETFQYEANIAGFLGVSTLIPRTTSYMGRVTNASTVRTYTTNAILVARFLLAMLEEDITDAIQLWNNVVSGILHAKKDVIKVNTKKSLITLVTDVSAVLDIIGDNPILAENVKVLCSMIITLPESCTTLVASIVKRVLGDSKGGACMGSNPRLTALLILNELS